MEEIASKLCEGAKSSTGAIASSNLSIKAQAARLFDDRQISQEIIESVDPVAVVLRLPFYQRSKYPPKFKTAFEDVQASLKNKYLEKLARVQPGFSVDEPWIENALSRSRNVQPCKSYVSSMSECNDLFILEEKEGTGEAPISGYLITEWANDHLPMFDLVLYAKHGEVKEETTDLKSLMLDWMSDNGYLPKEHHKSFLYSLSYQLTSEKKHNLDGNVDADGELRFLMILDGYTNSTEAKCQELEMALQSKQSYGFDYCLIITSDSLASLNVGCPAVFGRVLKNVSSRTGSSARSPPDAVSTTLLDEDEYGIVKRIKLREGKTSSEEDISPIEIDINEMTYESKQTSSINPKVSENRFYRLKQPTSSSKGVLSPADKKILDSAAPELCGSVDPLGLLVLLSDIITSDVSLMEIKNETATYDQSAGMFHLLRAYASAANSLDPLIAALDQTGIDTQILKRNKNPEFGTSSSRHNVAASSNLSIKEQAARIFDDREITQEIAAGVELAQVLPFLDGWCIQTDTAMSIADLPRPNAVVELTNAIKLCLRGIDDTEVDVVDQLEAIISAFESAQPSAKVGRLLREAALKLRYFFTPPKPCRPPQTPPKNLPKSTPLKLPSLSMSDCDHSD